MHSSESSTAGRLSTALAILRCTSIPRSGSRIIPLREPLPPLPSEQLLIEAIDAIEFSRCLVVSPGRGQVGWHAKQKWPGGDVTLWYIDSFRAAQATEAAANAGIEVDVVCSPDLPESPVQRALIPVLQRGEAEMTRDILQQAHERLEIDGVMIASVNNGKDRWLREQMQTLFEKVHCRQSPQGWVYSGRKLTALKKVRQFEAEFVFRDEDRLIRIVTRPSVFSHRSLDVAARLLVTHSNVQAGDRVADFGCGSGAVAIASALRSATGDVYAIDSNARSVDCARRSAKLNGADNVHCIVNHDGVLPGVVDCDLALLNPPYYGDFTIAIHFMKTASTLVREGGRVVVVTKDRDAYHEHRWSNLWLESETSASGYQLLTYRKRDY